MGGNGWKMKISTESLSGFFFGIIVFAIIIGIFVLIISKIPNQEEWGRQSQLTYDKCCNGNPCTDTYYDEEDGKCHSTFYLPHLTKWYVTIPIVLGVAFILTLIIRFIPFYHLEPEPK